MFNYLSVAYNEWFYVLRASLRRVAAIANENFFVGFVALAIWMFYLLPMLFIGLLIPLFAIFDRRRLHLKTLYVFMTMLYGVAGMYVNIEEVTKTLSQTIIEVCKAIWEGLQNLWTWVTDKVVGGVIWVINKFKKGNK